MSQLAIAEEVGEAREPLERAGELMVIIIVTHFLFSFCLGVVKKFTVIHSLS